VSDAEARKLLAGVPSDVIVLFDEAYFQFNTDTDTSVAMDLFREFPNVVVAHTFSKAYGLAGLRIGYAVGPENVIEAMRKVALPFAVSDLAQVAAVASLDAYDELDSRVQNIVAERERLVRGLRKLGYEIAEPQANFFWIAFGSKTEEAAKRFEAAGLAVRVFAPEGIRISIGESEANDVVLEVCAALAEEGFLA
jgi:histidinol-phosphate aminotransferase